jgi:hypothetical protein
MTPAKIEGLAGNRQGNPKIIVTLFQLDNGTPSIVMRCRRRRSP